MTAAENFDEFQMNPTDLGNLKHDLLVNVFSETHAQLLLYQQGRQLKAAKSKKIKKIPEKTSTVESKATTPSADILDDIKIEKELDALRKIFKLAYEAVTKEKENLSEQTPYLELFKAIEHQDQSSNEADALANELEENRSALKNLKELQVQQETDIAAKLSQKSQRVQELREQLNNIKRINRIELKLVEKWEANRLSQATIVGEKEERLLMQQILELRRRIAGEQRIIHEIKSFRNNEISELKEKIAEWQEKFKKEKTVKTIENLKLSQNIADIVKTHEKYREITEQRKKFVAEYMKQKAEEQRLYEEQCYRINCAIRIQAWWRGVMVRRGLGPHRKKSKKGKKSKSKK